MYKNGAVKEHEGRKQGDNKESMVVSWGQNKQHGSGHLNKRQREYPVLKA